MDASQSALDSLRTVEFRETLKGYHRDDVDEYLEKAAVEAEGLQEQLRQSGERLRQAAERISQLETALEQQQQHQSAQPQPQAQPQSQSEVPARIEPTIVGDDTLQRTLILAQKFVDETKADAEAQAARVISEANTKARMLTDQATVQASQIAAESDQRLREEVARLEDSRGRLTREVDTMSRHLESERNRLRTALSDILRWVDQNVQPTTPALENASGSEAPTLAPAPPSDPAPQAASLPPENDGPAGETAQVHAGGPTMAANSGGTLS
jgi:DivIVA domain-containing protein